MDCYAQLWIARDSQGWLGIARDIQEQPGIARDSQGQLGIARDSQGQVQIITHSQRQQEIARDSQGQVQIITHSQRQLEGLECADNFGQIITFLHMFFLYCSSLFSICIIVPVLDLIFAVLLRSKCWSHTNDSSFMTFYTCILIYTYDKYSGLTSVLIAQ